MKTQLRKVNTNALNQFSGQTKQIVGKLNADVLASIVNGLPGVSADLAKSLKETFRDDLPALGDRNDLDLLRITNDILFERLNAGDNKDDPNKAKDAKSKEQELKEAFDKALADQENKNKKGQDENKKALEDFTKGLNKQLDDLFKASQLAKNDKNDDKNKGLGDIPPPDTGSGSGGGEGSGSGGGDKGGGDKGSSSKGNDSPLSKDTKSKDNPPPLNFDRKEKTSTDLAKGDKNDEFKLDGPKKDPTEKPSTIKTGAGSVQQTAASDPSELLNPSVMEAPNQITGGSSSLGGITPSFNSTPEVTNGGGAGIQIESCSGSPLSNGDGNVFSGLGNVPYQGGDDRSRYFYQRTSDKDWVASSGSLADGDGVGDGNSSGSGDALSYGARGPASTLTSLGITQSREDSSDGDARGVFGASPLKKLCRSVAGATVGVCSPRGVKASGAGSLYEKARTSGFVRAAR